eukprot:GHVN01082559.1.p1 GENE.GHVN01082559.1~~GHVN01082559.1.p1  ORF type:complete len:288 (+),score=60.67 GHVN01082559.1:132-995(+)
MGLMKEASSSGVLAWCPYHSRRQILAVGSTSSDTARRAIPHLDFMTFDMADPTTTMPIVNSVSSGGQQFRSISWSGGDCSNPDGPFPLGLVAGSLDSCVGVWNPDPIIRGTNSPRSASSPESDSVDSALYRQIFPHQNFWSNCVRFNPHRSRVFGSASNNGHVSLLILTSLTCQTMCRSHLHPPHSRNLNTRDGTVFELPSRITDLISTISLISLATLSLYLLTHLSSSHSSHEPHSRLSPHSAHPTNLLHLTNLPQASHPTHLTHLTHLIPPRSRLPPHSYPSPFG